MNNNFAIKMKLQVIKMAKPRVHARLSLNNILEFQKSYTQTILSGKTGQCVNQTI